MQTMTTKAKTWSSTILMKIKNLILLIYFDLAWLASTWLVLNGKSLLTFALAAPALFVFSKTFSKKVLLISLQFALAGLLFDIFTYRLDFIDFFPFDTQSHFPLWMVGIWLLFLTVLPSLALMLKMNLFWSFVFGFIGGPMSYIIAQNIGVLKFSSNFSIALYALFWGLYLVLFSDRIKKEQPNENT